MARGLTRREREEEERRLAEIERQKDPDIIDTPKEMAEFEDFSKRWTAILKEGWDRQWLVSYGYDPPPNLYSPHARESDRVRHLEHQKWAQEQEAKRQKEQRARDLSEKAAERARQETYRRAMQ
jgi:hypothetical protein